jgi:hypothetical protein
MHVVHDDLLLLWAEVILAPLDCAAPVRAGTREVVLPILVHQPNDTPTFSLCRTEVVWGLAVLVEMAGHLTVVAGVMAATAGEASSFSFLGGGCASSKTV